MTGRGGRGGAGGRGRGRGPRNRSRGQNYTGSTRTTKKGLSAALGINVFDCGHKAAADEMRTSWEKLVENGENQTPQIVDTADDHDTPTAEPPLIVNGNEAQADHFPPDNEVQADYFAPDDSDACADPTAAAADAVPADI